MSTHFKQFSHEKSGLTITIRNEDATFNDHADFGDNRVLISSDKENPNEESYAYSQTNGPSGSGDFFFYLKPGEPGENPHLMFSTERNGTYTDEGALVSDQNGDSHFKLALQGGGIVIVGTTDIVLGPGSRLTLENSH